MEDEDADKNRAIFNPIMISKSISFRFLPLALIFTLGAFLRFFDLGKQRLFLDEAWSWAVARLDFKYLVALSFSDPHPPLYYALLKFVMFVVPDSEFNLRAFSVLFSLLSLWVIFVFIYTRWGMRPAIYTGLFMAVSSFDIYYAQEARMYTFSGFLWIVSTISLIKGVEGNRKYLIWWAVATILLAWTHLVNLLIAVTYLGVGGLYLFGAQKLSIFQHWKVDRRFFIMSLAAIALGIIPTIWFVYIHQGGYGAAGAWLPTAKDLLTLFLAWSVGLTAVRGHFLDSTHLTLPALANVPYLVWAGIGLILVGLPAVWGIYQTWKKGESYRTAILLSIVAAIAPILMTFGYAVLAHRPIWALKPYLGAGYLFYLWAGIGISALPNSHIRKAWGIIILVVAAASLIPYNFGWQKSPAGDALFTMPEIAEKGGLFLEPFYLSPLAFYYLGSNVPVYSVLGTGEMIQLQYSTEQPLGVMHPLSCEDLSDIPDIWVYKEVTWMDQEEKNWTECTQSKNLWGVMDAVWHPLNP